MIHNSLLQTLSTNFSSFSVWFKVAVQNLRKQAVFLTCAAQKCLICLCAQALWHTVLHASDSVAVITDTR